MTAAAQAVGRLLGFLELEAGYLSLQPLKLVVLLHCLALPASCFESTTYISLIFMHQSIRCLTFSASDNESAMTVDTGRKENGHSSAGSVETQGHFALWLH